MIGDRATKTLRQLRKSSNVLVEEHEGGFAVSPSEIPEHLLEGLLYFTSSRPDLALSHEGGSLFVFDPNVSLAFPPKRLSGSGSLKMAIEMS